MTVRATNLGRLRQAADDLDYIWRHYDTYQAKRAEYESAGWPSRGGDGTGRRVVGGTTVGILPVPDQLALAAKRSRRRLERVLADLADIRRHMHTMITPTSIDPSIGAEEQCANPNCPDIVRTPRGDLPLTSRCGPCHRYRVERGMDASARVIAERMRKRSERTT